ncbi:hypothetical protein RF11_11884 [Thelohanellus kitauei]|uniref:Uncharacterized protein n=1 Tax=Thelohanellus kitauei TaxID=669202 RepID=A0A0C2MWZ8_THEKT|nr:hypothetical protein RF11_11884 [Thelohanellus kitauei]
MAEYSTTFIPRFLPFRINFISNLNFDRLNINSAVDLEYTLNNVNNCFRELHKRMLLISIIERNNFRNLTSPVIINYFKTEASAKNVRLLLSRVNADELLHLNYQRLMNGFIYIKSSISSQSLLNTGQEGAACNSAK